MGGRSTFEKHFPLFGVERDCLISKGGDVTVVFEVTLPEVFTLQSEEYETLHASWSRALSLLPDYCVVHKQDWYFESACGADPERASFLDRAYDQHFLGRPYLGHRCVLSFTLSNQLRMSQTSMGSTLVRPSVLSGSVRDGARIEQFLEVVAQTVSILQGSGYLSIRRLGWADLVGGEPGVPGLLEEYLALRMGGHCCLSDFDFRLGECRLGDRLLSFHTLGDTDDLPVEVGTHTRVARLSAERSSTNLSFAAPVGLLLPYPHIYNQYLFILDSGRVAHELDGMRKRMTALSNFSRSNAVNAELIGEYLDVAAAGSLRCVRAHFNVLTWAWTREQLATIRNQVGVALAEMGCTPRLNTTDAARLFWAGLPGNASDFPMEESFYTFIPTALCLFVNETNYQSSLSAFGIRLSDRLSGQPIHVDISDEPMRLGLTTNRNKFVLGPSGSGKSFFTNHMVRQYYEQGAHVLLVDTGNSYEGLCELIRHDTHGADGVYFIYTDASPISFNPFYTDDYVFDIEKRESILTLLLTLWKSADQPATKTEVAELGRALAEYLALIEGDRTIVPSFNSFYEYLRDEYRASLSEREIRVRREDFDVDNLLITLAQYYRGGRYDFLLNSAQNLDLLSKRFIVFEIDAIKDNKELFPVVTIIIMEAFINKMRRLAGVRKMILIEEAWKAIASANMADYIKYLYKTVRKFFGEAVVVTQEVDDIIQSPVVKESIINNSDCKILLDQRKYMNKFDAIQALLGLTDRERNQILSMNTNNDPGRRYKEVWIGLGAKSAVYATEVSPEEYLTYTTEQREKMEVQEMAARFGGNLRLAIRELAERKRGWRFNNQRNGGNGYGD